MPSPLAALDLAADRLVPGTDLRFREAFEHAPIGMALIEPGTGRLLHVNQAYADITGYSRDELATLDVLTLTHADDRERNADVHRQLMRGEIPGFALEQRYVRRDGRAVWVRATTVVLRDERGEPHRVVGLVEDIDEHRRAADRADALQRITAALGAATTQSEIADVVATLGLAYLEATAGALLLPEPDEPTCVELLDAPGFDGVVRHLPLGADVPPTVAMRQGVPVLVATRAELEARFPAAGAWLAPMRNVEAIASAPVSMRDTIGGALVFTWSDALPADAGLVGRLDMVARLVGGALDRATLLAAERAARRDAEAASRAKSEFLAVMSHELRTPLNAISGHVELLEMGLHGPLTPTQLEALSRVTRAQRHLLALITDVLNFSRIEAGRVDYELSDVEIGEMIASVAPLIEPQLAARNLTYEVNAAARLVVRADRDKLRQVLLNLLSNAVKYTEPGGRVVVDTWTREDGGAFGYVRVRDTGCGIAPEKLDAIFEPFVRVDAGHTRRTDGAGLGLAIARDLARGMGGDLRARSIVGEGSSFTVSLPYTVRFDFRRSPRRSFDDDPTMK